MVLEGQIEFIRALAIAVFSTWPFAKKEPPETLQCHRLEMKAIVVFVKRC